MRSSFAIIAVLIFAGCQVATTTFKVYEDGGAHYRGSGGAKEIVDGVDIWTDGSPPRTYQIVGVIEDKRRNAAIPMASFKQDIAGAIKQHGGDAGIILVQGLHQLGTYIAPSMATTNYHGTATPTGFGNYTMNGTATTTMAPTYGIPISDQITKVAVIRYVE